jgi:hypothetical protein
MNITSINYQRTYPLGAYAPEKIGLEATIDGTTESPIETYLKLKELADQMHEMSVKSLPEHVSDGNEYRGTHEKIITPAPIENRVDEIVRDIGTCTSLKVLETYRFIKNTDPKLESAYNLKMSQLTENK